MTERHAVFDESRLLAKRVFQNTSLPVRNAPLTPASIAACTFARCSLDQYSSWPTVMNTLWFWIRLPRRAESTSVV